MPRQEGLAAMLAGAVEAIVSVSQKDVTLGIVVWQRLDLLDCCLEHRNLIGREVVDVLSDAQVARRILSCQSGNRQHSQCCQDNRSQVELGKPHSSSSLNRVCVTH